jgi:hypothetical protein
VLHEVGHHALGHTLSVATSVQASRQRELAADKWAFGQMKDLGYALFGIGSYFVARAMTDLCVNELGLIGDEKESTHPTWLTRDTALRNHFSVLTAPAQDLRIFSIPLALPEPDLTTVVIPDSSAKGFEAPIVQRGKVTLGMTEWDGKTARVYARGEGGARVELVIEDAMRIAPLIEYRVYDRNNRLVSSTKLAAVQADLVGLDFLEVGGLRFSDIRKRAKGQNLMVVHLRRAGASESAIGQALGAADQYKEDRRFFGLAFVKGMIDYATLAEEMRKKASIYEQRMIGILGENRYKVFAESFANEISKISPPMTGVDVWEERLLKENLGK